MKTSRPLKTVENWLKNNPDKVESYHIENDGYAGLDSPFSYWIYLNKGFINSSTETHSVHESSAKDVLDMTKYIEPCCCDSCRGL